MCGVAEPNTMCATFGKEVMADNDAHAADDASSNWPAADGSSGAFGTPGSSKGGRQHVSGHPGASPNTTVIVAGAVGGVVGLIALIALVTVVVRRRGAGVGVIYQPVAGVIYQPVAVGEGPAQAGWGEEEHDAEMLADGWSPEV